MCKVPYAFSKLSAHDAAAFGGCVIAASDLAKFVSAHFSSDLFLEQQRLQKPRS